MAFQKVKRRLTPDQEYDRLAERIKTSFGDSIEDGNSFVVAYKKYLSQLDPSHPLLTDEKNMNRTRLAYRAQNPRLSRQLRGRRSLSFSKEEQTELKEASEFDVLADVKGKTVYAKRTRHFRKSDNKRIQTLRDKRGKFARAKK